MVNIKVFNRKRGVVMVSHLCCQFVCVKGTERVSLKWSDGGQQLQQALTVSLCLKGLCYQTSNHAKNEKIRFKALRFL